MKPLQAEFNQRGQALVELVIILPVLITFLSGAALLLNYATTPLWLEELTALHLRLPESGQLYDKLQKCREGSMIPPYPAQRDLEINSISKNPQKVPLPLHRYYPGSIRKTEVLMDLSQFIKRAAAPFGYIPGVKDPILIDLRMIPLRELKEETVKDQIRRTIFPGSAMETIVGKLNALGLELVHLNLDAVPEMKKDGDRDRE